MEKKFVSKTKKRIDHLLADITFTINFKTERCNVKTKPIFLYGKYIKDKRGYLKKRNHVKTVKVRDVFFAIIMG